MQYITVRVSKATLNELERLKRLWGLQSIDEVIRKLVAEYRRSLIERYYGIDRGRVKPFTEEDKLEGRGARC